MTEILFCVLIYLWFSRETAGNDYTQQVVVLSFPKGTREESHNYLLNSYIFKTVSPIPLLGLEADKNASIHEGTICRKPT